MNLARLAQINLALIGLAVLSGCEIARQRETIINRRPTFALAVAVNGGNKPTPDQWATLDAAFSKIIKPVGQLVHDVASADEVIHVTFTPDPADLTQGSATIVAVVPNARGPYLYPWDLVIRPETNPRAFQLVMEELGTH